METAMLHVLLGHKCQKSNIFSINICCCFSRESAAHAPLIKVILRRPCRYVYKILAKYPCIQDVLKYDVKIEETPDKKEEEVLLLRLFL